MNYRHKEEQAQAVTHVRCGRVQYVHTPEGRQVLSFSAQEIVELPNDKRVAKGLDDLRTEFTGRESESFDLVSPETGAIVGSATYADLQAMLFSAYLAAEQHKEDVEQAEKAEEARLMEELAEAEAAEEAERA